MLGAGAFVGLFTTEPMAESKPVTSGTVVAGLFTLSAELLAWMVFSGGALSDAAAVVGLAPTPVTGETPTGVDCVSAALDGVPVASGEVTPASGVDWSADAAELRPVGTAETGPTLLDDGAAELVAGLTGPASEASVVKADAGE